jgi:hypothetical protein
MSTNSTQLELTNIYEGIESITFPFKNSFVVIEGLPKEEWVTKRCPLCGNTKELTYQKDNDGFATLICRSCAIGYVESAKRIDELQKSEIEERETHTIPSRDVAKPFLVRVIMGRSNHWVDIETGTIYEESDISYEHAHHGLCEQYGRPVLKNDGFPPLVFIAKEKPKPFGYSRSIKVPFMNADKQRSTWEFSPYELEEVSSGLKEGLTVKQIATRVCAPLEAVETVIEKNLGGDINGTKRNKAKRKREPARNRVTRRRKNAG